MLSPNKKQKNDTMKSKTNKSVKQKALAIDRKYSKAMSGSGNKEINISESEYDKFVKYVASYYGKDGIFKRFFPPKGASIANIKRAINMYFNMDNNKKYWSSGDSLDRERVSEYLFEILGTPKDANIKEYDNGGSILQIGFLTYYAAVNHFMFFSMNYPENFIDAWEGNIKNHLKDKFYGIHKQYGAYEAIIRFWLELSDNNKEIFAKWIQDNYKGDKVKAKVMPSLYLRAVNHFTKFLTNYPANFMDAFKGQGILQDHIRSKFDEQYEKHGAFSGMMAFWFELSSENRQTLTRWAMENYTEEKMAKGGKLPEIAHKIFVFLPFAEEGSDTLDGIEAWTFGDLWNGWQTPYFEKDKADQIVKDLRDEYPAEFKDNGKTKSYIFTIEGETDIFVAQTIQTTEGEKEVYPIGAYSWVWKKAEEEFAKGGKFKGEELPVLTENTSTEDCEDYLKWLAKSKYSYHLDDDVHNIDWQTSSPTEDQLDILQKNTTICFEKLGNDKMWEVFYKAATGRKKYHDGGSVKPRYTNTDQPAFTGNVWAMVNGTPKEFKIVEHIASSVSGSGNEWRHDYIVIPTGEKTFRGIDRFPQNYLASTREELLEQYNNPEFAYGGLIRTEKAYKSTSAETFNIKITVDGRPLNIIANVLKENDGSKDLSKPDYTDFSIQFTHLAHGDKRHPSDSEIFTKNKVYILKYIQKYLKEKEMIDLQKMEEGGSIEERFNIIDEAGLVIESNITSEEVIDWANSEMQHDIADNEGEPITNFDNALDAIKHLNYKIENSIQFEEGGSIEKSRLPDKSKQTAIEILRQIGGMNRIKVMTGAYNFVALENGVSFRIKNTSANYVKVTLNAMDLYDLEVGRIRGEKYTIVYEAKGIYNDAIKGQIEKGTGTYLSLKDGGSINNLRTVKVTYDTGDITETNMAAHLTDDEIREYYRVGKSFNIGSGETDKMAKVKSVEILFAKGGITKKGTSLIEKETVLLPYTIADGIAPNMMDSIFKSELENFDKLSKAQKEEFNKNFITEQSKLIEYLVQRAEKSYKEDESFRKKLKRPGNAGRDFLHMIMERWARKYEIGNESKKDTMHSTANPKKSIQQKIAGFETLLKVTKAKADIKTIKTKLAGFKVALKYLPKENSERKFYNLEVRKTEKSPWIVINKDLMTKAVAEEAESDYKKSGKKYFDLRVINEIFAEGGTITKTDIKEGAKFKTKSGIVWIIDEVKENDPDFGTAVRTSMEGGKKGNYRDSIEEVIIFLMEEGAILLTE
jgi:hypothetical protein